MSIKLVAVDIDGTLLNNKKEITPEVVTPFFDGYKVYAPGDEDDYRFYDWGVDEPMGLRRKGGWLD